MAAKELIANLSEEHKIPQENIFNPEDLRQICFEPPTPLSKETLEETLRTRMVRPWQIDLVVEGLLVALAAKPKENQTEELDSSS
jgi:ribonuclease D